MKINKIYLKGIAILLGVGAVYALPPVQQTAQSALQSAQARALARVPPVTYWLGEVGLEFQVRDIGPPGLGHKRLVVKDMVPTDSRLFALDGTSVLVDDRAPVSGHLLLNGNTVPLQAGLGELYANIPQSAFSWFGSNTLLVQVFDGSGAHIADWRVSTGSLL